MEKIKKQFENLQCDLHESPWYRNARFSWVWALVALAGLVIVVGGNILARSFDPKQCSDFNTREEAQEYFDTKKAQHLDRNRNGIACERDL